MIGCSFLRRMMPLFRFVAFIVTDDYVCAFSSLTCTSGKCSEIALDAREFAWTTAGGNTDVHVSWHLATHTHLLSMCLKGVHTLAMLYGTNTPCSFSDLRGSRY